MSSKAFIENINFQTQFLTSILTLKIEFYIL